MWNVSRRARGVPLKWNKEEKIFLYGFGREEGGKKLSLLKKKRR
jgi:hypothetical protein